MTEQIITDSPERSRVPAGATEPILVFRGLTKRFGGATALDHVDFDLMPGEIHGLVGENGAGKSTMMKILSGLHTPDEGEMLLRGEPVQFASPAEAKARGIGMIYQELSCMPALSVAENVFLGSQPTKGGLVDWGRMRREAAQHLGVMGIDVDVTAPASSLSLGGQQLVEIARVVFSGASIIVLDEPTSALSAPESERLFRAMAELKARGATLVFISHFLEDVLAVSDRITVLKNSRKVATLENQGVTKQQLIQLMIGHDAEILAEGYEGGVHLPPAVPGTPALEVQGLSGAGFTDLTFTAHQGEILGIFGNLGAGMTEMARVIFGRERPATGSLRLDGKVIAPKSTREAKQLGIAYLSENRRATIFPRHEIFKNITLAHLDQIVGRVVRQPREIAIATDLVKRTGVRPPRPTLAAGNLSGGNQQKVVLAKWLTVQPKVLILNEPTRGMDVGAKREVLDLVKALRSEGVSIILISTEPETVLAESDRILVMSKGQITKEFVGERVSKDLLMSYA
ncbi:MAG: sugar ABC transporter ATP-binding protein [Thermomicrobiales bacterium]|nr:sugar ABC transporter ATP-binding protein [Thermomicrobiales bacterium]MCA9880712.1 sugar ABC transporter ATP-binding protein [Thermomicrobiales bacterium]